MRSAMAVTVVAATALVLAGCTTGKTTGSGAAPVAPATVESAGGGEVAGFHDSKSNCYFKWNDDPTADVRLYNRIQRVGVTPQFTLAGSDLADSGVWMENYEKHWENGAAYEGAFQCAAVPYMVQNNANQTYYWWDGNVWSDHPGWWGHTKELSGDNEPLGWVRFQCRGKPVNRNQQGAPACPDSALEGGYVQANWNTEGDNEKELYKKPNCVSTSPTIGCWTNSYHGGQYDGQFVFDTTAWTAPIRVTLTTSAQDDAGNIIAWKVANATENSTRWAYGNSPAGRYVLPGRDSELVVGAYAEASRGEHTITLTLVPAYSVNAQGKPLACTETTSGTKVVIDCKPVDDVAKATKPVLNKNITATVSVGLNLWKGEGGDGTPKVEKVITSCTYNQNTTRSRTFEFTCIESGKPFSYGGNWSVSMKTTE